MYEASIFKGGEIRLRGPQDIENHRALLWPQARHRRIAAFVAFVAENLGEPAVDVVSSDPR